MGIMDLIGIDFGNTMSSMHNMNDLSQMAGNNNNNENEERPTLLMLLINESGAYFSKVKDSTYCNIKEFEAYLNKLKLTNCFEKTNCDLDYLRANSNKFIYNKCDLNMGLDNYTLNCGASSVGNSSYSNRVNGGNSYSSENGNYPTWDFNSNPNITKFNQMLEDYLKQNMLSQEESENHNLINKSYNNWMWFFNVSLPFNIIMKYQSLYMKLVVEFSENIASRITHMNEVNDARHVR